MSLLHVLLLIGLSAAIGIGIDRLVRRAKPGSETAHRWLLALVEKTTEPGLTDGNVRMYRMTTRTMLAMGFFLRDCGTAEQRSSFKSWMVELADKPGFGDAARELLSNELKHW